MRPSFFIIALITQVISEVTCARRRKKWMNEDEMASMPPPTFRDTPTKVTVRQGQTAKLECSLDYLGTKKVVWMLKSYYNPLTIGVDSYADPDRYQVQHEPLGPEWNLIIRQARLGDAGTYECQVSSTDRGLRREVTLSVRRRRKPKEKKIQPGIKLFGKTFVEKGHKLKLVCNATGSGSPEDLDWFLNGQKLVTDTDKKMKILKSVSLMKKTISSSLEVASADMEDAGIYVCRTSDLQIASARVDILNADTNNVKRGTEKDSANGSKSGSGSGSRSRQGRLDSGNNQASTSAWPSALLQHLVFTFTALLLTRIASTEMIMT